MIFNKDKDTNEFLHKLTKLEPEQFIALAKVLEVKMSTVDPNSGEYALRDAADISEDMVTNFRKLDHKYRKLVLKVMKK